VSWVDRHAWTAGEKLVVDAVSGIEFRFLPDVAEKHAWYVCYVKVQSFEQV
jgi:hypothetical protein